MNQPPEVVDCTGCGVRPGRNFVTSIKHGVTTQSNLCDECLASTRSPLGIEIPNLEGAKCDFCDAPAIGATPKSSLMSSSPEPGFEYSCMRCVKLKREETQAYIGNKSASELIEAGMAGLDAMFREVDARVRRRAKNKNE